MNPGDEIVRPITQADSANLSTLINNAEYIHRHLDWRAPQDWIGEQPFLGIEKGRKFLAALACPRIDARIGWIRLFAFLNWSTSLLENSWSQLFQALSKENRATPTYTFAALGLQPWFSNLLISSGFVHNQEIVVLEWRGQIPPRRPFPPEVTLREMGTKDLAEVQRVDNLAFDPLWHHTGLELELAFQQAAYATVAEMDGKIVAYQISTGTPFHAHLARLAVDPELQRLSLGYGLVRDLLVHFSTRGIGTITVNTQNDNFQSLGLYQRTGFWSTGENIPVFTLSAGQPNALQK